MPGTAAAAPEADDSTAPPRHRDRDRDRDTHRDRSDSTSLHRSHPWVGLFPRLHSHLWATWCHLCRIRSLNYRPWIPSNRNSNPPARVRPGSRLILYGKLRPSPSPSHSHNPGRDPSPPPAKTLRFRIRSTGTHRFSRSGRRYLQIRYPGNKPGNRGLQPLWVPQPSLIGWLPVVGTRGRGIGLIKGAGVRGTGMDRCIHKGQGWPRRERSQPVCTAHRLQPGNSSLRRPPSWEAWSAGIPRDPSSSGPSPPLPILLDLPLPLPLPLPLLLPHSPPLSLPLSERVAVGRVGRTV